MDIASEIQNHLFQQLEPLTNHFKEITERLETEFENFKFKGKEVKIIEEKINSLFQAFKNVQLNQETLMKKIDTFNSVSCFCLKTRIDSNEIDILAESFKPHREAPIVPSQEDKVPVNHSVKLEHSVPNSNLIDVNKESQKKMLAAIPKNSDWPTFSGEGEYEHTECIEWIDTLKSEIDLNDRIIILRLNLLSKSSSNEW